MKDYLQYIDDYISGKLPPGLMEEMKERLEIDEELHEEYQILRKSREYLKAKSMMVEIESDPDLANAEEIVDKYYQETDISSGVKRRRQRFFYLITTSAAAIFVGIFIIIRSFAGLDPNERLYKRFYEPVSRETLDLTFVRGINGNNLIKGIECYLQQDYTCSIECFSKDHEYNYHLGLAYLGNNNPLMAKAYFLMYRSEHPELPDVNWYLALTHISLNELDEAYNSLGKLLVSENRYRKRAIRLMRKLENLKKADRLYPVG